MDERTLKDEPLKDELVLRAESESLDDELGVVLETTEDDGGDDGEQETQGKRDFSRFAGSLPLPR